MQKISWIIISVFIVISTQFFISNFKILNRPAQDFEVFYLGGQQASLGNNPYNKLLNKDPFKNPPQSIILFSTFSKIPIIYSQAVWTVLSFLAFLTGSYFLFKTLKIKQNLILWFSYLISVLVFFPFRYNIGTGQINNFLFLLIVLAFYFMQGKRYFLAGVALTVAIVLKITPLIFILILIFQKKFQILTWTFLIIIILTFYSILLYEPKIISNFLIISKDFFDNGISAYYNQSLIGFIARAFDNRSLTSLVSLFLLFPSLIFLVFLTVKTSRHSIHANLLLWSIGIIYILIFSSYAWQYQFVLIIFSLASTFYLGLKMKLSYIFFLLLFISYLSIGVNIKTPQTYEPMGLAGVIIISHVFWGTLILLLLSYYLAIKLLKSKVG